MVVFLFLGLVWAEAREFTIRKEMVPMRDGVRIATTIYFPVPKSAEEKLPVLIEMQPYRKDDLFLARDYSLNAEFARHGFVVIKADVRGTGSSEGAIPEREYSEDELADAEELIAHYSRQPWSNGNVGMWGISWSGFNALMTAMRKPPALKAILAAHASDDLFHDDVRFLDGNFHVDPYELSIENDLSLPRSPDYRMDAEYFRDRFDREPWFIRYKREGRDGPFWQKESLRGQYEKLTTPAFLLGGLLDGYRDSLVRILEHAPAPSRALIGPWNHSWPDMGSPCPCPEWRDEALSWWTYWLKGEGPPPPTGEMIVFQREYAPPSVNLQSQPGSWQRLSWRSRETANRDFFLHQASELASQPGSTPVWNEILSRPQAGAASGFWWGDLTPDMSAQTAHKTVWDSLPLTEEIKILGFPVIQLKVQSSQPWSHWALQLEDVAPNGQAALVTGSVVRDTTAAEMHFTSWTFAPGHRIRLSLSPFQFPMIWPLPEIPRTFVEVGTPASFLRLPELPASSRLASDFQKPPRPRETYPGLASQTSDWPASSESFYDSQGRWTVRWRARKEFAVDRRQHRFFEENTYRVNPLKPQSASYRGRAGHQIRIGSRRIQVKTEIDLHSDARYFHIRFTRRAFENGKKVRVKTWREKILRLEH